jgi:hypothetical protein
MVGVDMGIYRLYQFQIQFIDEADILSGVIQHRVNQQCFAALPFRQEVGVCARGSVEQLTKYHSIFSRFFTRYKGSSPDVNVVAAQNKKRTKWR